MSAPEPGSRSLRGSADEASTECQCECGHGHGHGHGHKSHHGHGSCSHGHGHGGSGHHGCRCGCHRRLLRAGATADHRTGRRCPCKGGAVLAILAIVIVIAGVLAAPRARCGRWS